ncbi:MAG: 8-amino-7-oxononanoate synthase [Planctomycetota bacterium]
MTTRADKSIEAPTSGGPVDDGPLGWLPAALEELDTAGMRRRLISRGSGQAAAVKIDGRRLVNFSSNDYLGLAGDPRVVAAAQQAAADDGWGAGASPLVTGRSDWHRRLEAQIAALEQTEAALLFPSGFAANAGTTPALVERGDAIFADAKNHASIIDGCRLSGAERFIYPHGDADALAQLLTEQTGFRRRLIVTDTLFSMDGDLAPLDRLAELAVQHNAMLMVDEAHATGVIGAGGRGVAEHFEGRDACGALAAAALIRVGTLSKALGSAGGFVAGSQALIDWLANRARSYVFSTAAPSAAAAAGLAAIGIVQQEPDRRATLLARAGTLRGRLRDAGWDTGASVSQIVPIHIGDAGATMRLAAGLREAGLLVPGIRPPSVPAGQSLLRVSLCLHHTEEDLDRLIAALDGLRGSGLRGSGLADTAPRPSGFA